MECKTYPQSTGGTLPASREANTKTTDKEGKGEEHKSPMQLLQEIIEAFPQADTCSEFYNEDINGCEAVNFLSQIVPQIRQCLDTPEPKVAIVVDGGIVQHITSDRPDHVYPRNFIMIDYDTDGVGEDETISIPQNDAEGTVNDAFAQILKPGQAEIDLDSVVAQLKTE